jgi:hypothetical protein
MADFKTKVGGSYQFHENFPAIAEQIAAERSIRRSEAAMPARRKATTRKIVLIGGSYYAGEMKKSFFATLNYYLPEKGVMPMHCSANPLWHRQDHALGRSDAHADRPTTSTAGARTASSISKAAATPNASSRRRKPSPRFMPPASASARCWKTSCWTPIPASRISTTAR